MEIITNVHFYPHLRDMISLLDFHIIEHFHFSNASLNSEIKFVFLRLYLLYSSPPICMCFSFSLSKSYQILTLKIIAFVSQRATDL